MSSFMISIPSDEPELRDEIEQELSAHARVTEAPRRFGGAEMQMIVDISTIAANGAAIVTFLLMLKDRYKSRKKPSGIRIAVPGKDDMPLDDVDEAILKRMMGLDKS